MAQKIVSELHFRSSSVFGPSLALLLREGRDGGASATAAPSSNCCTLQCRKKQATCIFTPLGTDYVG